MLDTDDYHPHAINKESNCKELLEKSKNLLVIMNDVWWLIYYKGIEY